MNNEDVTFEWRDEFGRIKVAERLVSAFGNDAPISPLMLTGDWGGGKTEFTLKAINLIKKKLPSVTPVYLDAYKTDYHDDPLLALSAAVIDALPVSEQSKVRKRLIPVVRAVGKMGLKALSSWVLKQDVTDALDDMDKDIKKTADKASDLLIDSVLQDQIDANELLDAFKSVLTKATEDRKLIFFIDELDRCKPTYSVQMLELVKHVFDIENVKFVLIVNRLQLEASINHHYGIELDAKRYLDKFIAFALILPEKLKDYGRDRTTVSSIHFESCVRNCETLSSALYRNNQRSFLYSEVYAMCLLDGLSLREIETFVRYLEIYQKISSEEYSLNHENGITSAARAFGVYLTCFHQSKAHQLSIDNLPSDIIYKVLKKAPILPFLNRSFDDLDLLTMAIFIDAPENTALEPESKDDALHLSKWRDHIDKVSRSATFYFSDVEPFQTMKDAIKIMSFNEG